MHNVDYNTNSIWDKRTNKKSVIYLYNIHVKFWIYLAVYVVAIVINGEDDGQDIRTNKHIVPALIKKHILADKTR